MNTPQTEDEKRRIIADIIRDRLPWQARASQDHEWAAPAPAGSIPITELYLNTPYPLDIRIAPAPPEPEKWFPDKGQWYEENISSGWYRAQAAYDRADYVRIGREYRPCDPPPEPEWGELGPEDVPPGSVFRKPGCDGYCYPQYVGIRIIFQDGRDPVSYNYKRLMSDGWQILRPGGTWEPCRKANA